MVILLARHRDRRRPGVPPGDEAARSSPCLLLALPARRARRAVGQVTRGQHLYGRYCASCHGPDGSAQTRSAATRAAAGPRATSRCRPALGPPLRGVGALAADFYLRTGYMPLTRAGVQPRRTRVLLSGSEIRALVAYVASLGTGPPVPTPHPERGNLVRGPAACSPSTAPAATRSSPRAATSPAPCRRRSTTRRPCRSPRRCASART